MKTLLVSLSQFNRIDDVLKMAVYIGRQHSAHIIGYYPIPGPSIMVLTHPGAYVPLDNRIQKMYEDQAKNVKAKFEDIMNKENLKSEWRQVRLVTSDIVGGIVEHGRESDLIILPQDESGGTASQSGTNLAAEVVLSAGRPILLVPPLENKYPKLDKIIVGWNASRESCRATFDSLSLLKIANNVHLTWVNPEKTLGKGGKLPGAELAAALARHDVNVTTKGLSNRSKPGQALLTYARDQNADLLVIGAYGHSRLRERILGGATEYILQHLKIPLLMSN